MKKEELPPPFSRTCWCDVCKSFTDHLIYYVGPDKNTAGNILFYKFCKKYIADEYANQKAVFEKKFPGLEFGENNFSITSLVETIPQNDWLHLCRGDY